MLVRCAVTRSMFHTIIDRHLCLVSYIRKIENSSLPSTRLNFICAS